MKKKIAEIKNYARLGMIADSLKYNSNIVIKQSHEEYDEDVVVLNVTTRERKQVSRAKFNKFLDNEEGILEAVSATRTIQTFTLIISLLFVMSIIAITTVFFGRYSLLISVPSALVFCGCVPVAMEVINYNITSILRKEFEEDAIKFFKI